MKKIYLVFVLFLINSFAFAQMPNDCVNAITVCGNGYYSSNANGYGNTQEIRNFCGGQEHNSIWLKVNIVQAGSLGFNIRPDSPSLEVDYDFWVFGPNLNCGNLGNPIRCNTANPQSANHTTNLTGMSAGSNLTQTGPGTGNQYVRWLDNVLPGQFYYIAIDRPVGTGGFSIEWTGTATTGNGAFPQPPIANDITEIQSCSTNGNVGLFDLNAIKTRINPNIFDNIIVYYSSLQNAVDQANPLGNVISNNINPQTIYARVTNDATKCFSISEVVLKVYEIPRATITTNKASLCIGESFTYTITGTPGATVFYTINGVQSQCKLDEAGLFTAALVANENKTFALTDAKIISDLNVVACSTVLNQQLTVNAVESPVVNTVNTASVCRGNDGTLTLEGTPNAVVELTGSTWTGSVFVTIPASGELVYTIPIPDQFNAAVTVTVVKIENATGCKTIYNQTYNVTVNDLPVLNQNLNLQVCVAAITDNYLFDLIPLLQSITAYEAHAYATVADAALRQNEIVSYTSNTANAVIAIELINRTTGCSSIVSASLTKNETPQLPAFPTVEICDSYTLPVLTVGKYYTQSGGNGQEVAAGTTLTQTQTLFVFAQSAAGNCVAEATLQINISQTPIIDRPSNVIVCESYILPALTVGTYFNQPNGQGGEIPFGTTINVTQTLYVHGVSSTNTNCISDHEFEVKILDRPTVPTLDDVFSCDVFVLQQLAQGKYYTATNGGGQEVLAGTPINSTTTLYIYNTNGVCSAESTLHINISKTPNLSFVKDITSCGTYVLPSLTEGSYYTQPNGGGTVIPAGTAITNSQQLYVYAVNPNNANCTAQVPMYITLMDAPTVQPLDPIRICDQDFTNDGKTTIDLTPYGVHVFGNLDATQFEYGFFRNSSDALQFTNKIENTTEFTNTIAFHQVLYVGVRSTVSEDLCISIVPLDLTINPLPEATAADGFICVDAQTMATLNTHTIVVQPKVAGNYTYEWYLEDFLLPNTTSTWEADQVGTYRIYLIDNATNCRSLEPVVVYITPTSPAVFNNVVLTRAFSNSQTFTAIMESGLGDYEYSIDGIQYQDSPVFHQVLPGRYLIYARDKNPGGCQEATFAVETLSYPNFFTPNADGINDTWNIPALVDQPDAEIAIFDRMGKLMTVIQPNQPGWDGTLEGIPQPATDYWFVVTYREGENKATFKAHFSLKR